MTATTEYLLAIARRIADAYTSDPLCVAAMVTGSVSEDTTDHFSDIDMTVYYSELPPEDVLEAARRSIPGAGEVIWRIGTREHGSQAVAFVLDGIECQIGQTTVAAWERDMDTVLVAHNTETPLQKALEGTLNCIPLYGEELIHHWKSRATDYPDALQVAMAARHLLIFPIWGLQERFGPRDAVLWQTQALLEGVQNLLGVLAGINRLYYSTFQFKRMRRFIDKMAVRPENLAVRIENLFHGNPDAAADELERLASEVAGLVETHLPSVDTAPFRKRLGWRQQPWTEVVPLASG